MAAKLKLSIQINDDGTMGVVDAKGKKVKKVSSEEFAKSLKGKTIKNAFTPEIVVLQSNPTWVCINGVCYYIP